MYMHFTYRGRMASDAASGASKSGSVPARRVPAARGRSVWGPPTWRFLHMAVEQTGEAEWEREGPVIVRMLMGLCFHLPCDICAEHARAYVRGSPVPVGRAAVREWLWRFHNAVRARTGSVAAPEAVLGEYARGSVLDACRRMAGSWTIGMFGASGRRAVLRAAREWAAGRAVVA
jgi:hypothetical protein